MKCFIVVNPLGVFAVDESGNIVDREYFKKGDKKNALKISPNMINEELVLINRLKTKGFNEFVSSKKNENYIFEQNNFGELIIRKNFRKIVDEIGFQDINEYLTNFGIELTKIRIKQNVKKDRIAMEVVDAIDEIDKSINIYVARIREWYGLHFPELEQKIDKHEKFIKLISIFGSRDKISEFADLAKSSMGLDFNEKDEEIVKEYATAIYNMYKLREKMEKYLEDLLKEISPNFSSIAGPLLAARLIALAGGYDKLAKKPSSTIQLLGAEKALFRYLHGHGKSPKHGVLFTHNLIQQAPPNKRGKIARVIASKLSIAIKMDFYGSGDKSEELKKELKERIEKILREG
ncbi:MAG: hypothetical protein QXM68_00720 [Candidatus Aenigmatarchaeota archaeon]|nr:hypothetical protein [Candidatus Aenigmarchaeota archaeon]